MTTEELDALDALRECATPAPWLHSMWRSHEDCDTLQWCAIGPAHDAAGNEEEDDDSTAYGAAAVDADYLTALVNAAPRLLAEAREAATLRAKLAEVTGQRDELREAAGDAWKLTDILCLNARNGYCRIQNETGECALCNMDARVAAALEAAR